MIELLLVLQLSTASIQTPSMHSRVDMGLGITGLSASSIALGLTMACTSAKTCKEMNSMMARWIGDGPVKATVIKSSLNGLSYYGAWRLTHNKPKTRTILLSVLTTINVWDAVHDIRQARLIK